MICKSPIFGAGKKAQTVLVFSSLNNGEIFAIWTEGRAFFSFRKFDVPEYGNNIVDILYSVEIIARLNSKTLISSYLTNFCINDQTVSFMLNSARVIICLLSGDHIMLDIPAKPSDILAFHVKLSLSTVVL